MTERGAKISGYGAVTVAGRQLFRFQLLIRRFVAAWQDTQHQEEQG